MKNTRFLETINSLKKSAAVVLALAAGAALANAGNAYLKTSDGSGTTSITGSTNWTIVAAPSAANDYYTSNWFLRTPTGTGTATFSGHSLTLQPPSGQSSPNRSLLYKGGNSYVLVINNFTNAGGVIDSGAGPVAAPTFTGNLMTVVSNSMIQADQGSFIIGYPLAGSADLTNTSSTTTTITFTNNNSAFTGRFIINNSGTVSFTSSNGAPGNPAVPTPSQIDLGAGCTLLDYGGISLTNANGGVTLEGSATINVSSNTMVISEPITDNGNGYNLIKRGGAVLTLAGSNTFGGGLTLYGITAGGQLNINHPNALGTGTFIINSGNNAVIDNTSGGAVSNANNNAQTWANSFAFKGSTNLSLGSGNVTMSGSLTVTVSNNNLTVGPVSDGGSGYGLTKAGPGALTLYGGGSYSGATTISGGTLAITGSGSLSSSVINVASNAVLDVSAVGGLNLNGSGILEGSGTIIGSVTDNSSTTILPAVGTTPGTLTVNGNLTLNGSGGVTFDVNSGSTTPGGGINSLVVVSGTLNLANPTTAITISGVPAVGTYTLFQYGTLAGSVANLSVPIGYTLVNNTVNNSIQLLVTNVPVSITWVGDGSGNVWDLDTTANWKQGTTNGVYFFTGDTVTFDDSGSASPAIALNGSVSPMVTIVTNVANTYDFTGAGILTGSLIKSGSGTLILENSNSYSGPTVINGGTVQLGTGGSFGELGTGAVTNNGALVIDDSGAANFPAAISGTGSLTLEAGTATLSASNSYTGLTTATAGTFFVVNAASLGATNTGTVVTNTGQIYITANVNIGLEPLSLAGTGDGNGALRKGGGGASSYNGAVTLGAAASIGLDGGATLTLSNKISGLGPLTASGSASGTLVLAAANNFSDGFILNGPVVDLNVNSAVGTNPVTISGTGRIVLGTGVVFTNFVQATTVSPGVATGLLMVNDNTNGTVTTISGPLEFDASPANGGDFFGPTSSGYLSVAGPVTNNSSGLVSSRNGFVRFSGGGSYTTFNVNQGTASIGANNGLCTNATLSLSLSGASGFDLNGFSQILAGLTDGGTYGELVTNSSTVASVLTITPSSSYTFGGFIGGKLSLVVNGSGSLYLTNNSTYTGNTTLSAGTLELGVPFLAATSTVSVASGAVLQLDFTTTNTVGSLVLNGVSQAPGVYNSTTASPYLSGNGSLLVPSPINPYRPVLQVAAAPGSLSLGWPTNLGWILQSNAVGLTATNAWFSYPADGSVGVTNVNISLDPSKTNVFFRMVKP